MLFVLRRIRRSHRALPSLAQSIRAIAKPVTQLGEIFNSLTIISVGVIKTREVRDDITNIQGNLLCFLLSISALLIRASNGKLIKGFLVIIKALCKIAQLLIIAIKCIKNSI